MSLGRSEGGRRQITGPAVLALSNVVVLAVTNDVVLPARQ